MSTVGTWYIYPDGEASEPGVDHGNGRKSIVVWAENRRSRTICFKIPSGKHWGSTISPSVSHPGHYEVWAIDTDDKTEFGRVITGRRLLEMPLTQRGRR